MDVVKRTVQKFQYNSPVTLTFVFVSLLALLIGRASQGASNTLLFCVYRAPWTDPLSYIRIFTHVLGHTSWTHFSGNMVLFLVLGPLLEEKYGSKALLLMIVITSFISGGFYLIFYPNSALLGASGIVFMMIVLSSAAGMKEGRIPLTMLLVMAIYLGGEIVSGYKANDGIAYGAHILGGLCGATFGFFMLKKLKR